ncbi:flagellar protein FlgN [Marinobacterium sp. MBR-109]|jgi:flagellar biosynthesis/type III secretory pathway chaperone|uniref:flagella synthesis protein FlgN n=1 Tax=Marinobacterium sp. MBR-109 TaxID=3156462 RepID=UPI0033938F73
MTDQPAKDISIQLGALIDQGVVLLSQLQKLLDTELAALETRDLEQLKQSNQQKQECLLGLDRNIRERNALLTQLQVETSRDAVVAFIRKLPAPASELLEQAWQRLEQSLEQVRMLNQRNEQTLLRSKQNTDQLLALLQGHAQGNSIYDQKGDKGRYEGQRSLGKA